MKALTLTQPWATLVAIGAKRIETRSWSTGYRGRLAIHAAKGMPADAVNLCRERPFRDALAFANYVVPGELPRGAVIAIAMLYDVVPTERWIDYASEACPGSEEYAFGDFSPGRFMWLFTDVAQLDPHEPARGALGLWEWTA